MPRAKAVTEPSTRGMLSESCISNWRLDWCGRIIDTRPSLDIDTAWLVMAAVAIASPASGYYDRGLVETLISNVMEHGEPSGPVDPNEVVDSVKPHIFVYGVPRYVDGRLLVEGEGFIVRTWSLDNGHRYVRDLTAFSGGEAKRVYVHVEKMPWWSNPVKR